MEEIQAPKKERKFLKAVVNIVKVLANELVMGIARKFIGKAIDKVGNKRQGLIIASVILASTFAFAQYPATGNKQRLGFQTSGDGLVYRGRAADTVGIKSSGLNNAYFILDTVNNVVYNYIKTKGGWLFNNSDTIIINNNFIQPVDSLFFKTSVATNNVDTAKMRWDFDLGTVVLGMYDKVPNELGFKNFWLVKNQTGSTITKGSIVYANGTVGASGRITIAKFIANGSIDAKYLLGITAHDLTDGEDGYVMSYGKIRQVNTDTFTAGAILYPSPTVAGVWTDVEPVAPNIDMPIGFCINSHVNNGTIAIRVASGYKLSELHDVAISSPVENSSLYYKSGLWRDTTAALLVSDTSSMLTPYLRKLDTISLSNRINLKLNISDTASMLTPYFRDADTTSLNLTSRFAAKLNISDTASMLTPYFRDADTTSLNLTSRFAAKLNISDTASMLTNYLRSGLAASTYQAKLNGIGLVYANGTNISYDNSTYLTTSSAATTYQTILTNPVTGTGTNNYIPKFTTTGSTIGNSTLIDNGSTISTSSIFSTTNYASFNTTQVMGSSSGLLSTHRFTSANANGVYNKDFFLTSYMGAPWQGSDVGSGNRSKPPIVAIVNNNDPSFINSGLHLMTTNSTNNTYTPAITFGVNSENGSYYNTIGAITAKKLNTGNYTSQSAGQLEFFGTGTSLDATGASMTTANMTLGVGVGIGYTTAPTVRGRLTVLEKLGINQSTPNFALDVNGTANITGAATLGSTLAVTNNITEGGNNVLTNLDTASLSSRIDLKLNKTDTASLSSRINGKVSLTGDEYINGQKTFGGLIIPSNGMQLTATGNNSNKLIGINTSSFVGEVTLGTGLSLTSNVLNATERFYFDLGIVAGAADNSAATYDFTYGSNIFIVPTSLNGYCIDSVYIRAIGCSTCPPVSPDLDYYVGVYKANAGARVATSGATLVGSQIAMNEYDLNQVNRNDTLSTGEAWWVYLNGTYTSDLAYVTAGFIVKKTCN
jgi:hypothetical protein